MGNCSWGALQAEGAHRVPHARCNQIVWMQALVCGTSHPTARWGSGLRRLGLAGLGDIAPERRAWHRAGHAAQPPRCLSPASLLVKPGGCRLSPRRALPRLPSFWFFTSPG